MVNGKHDIIVEIQQSLVILFDDTTDGSTYQELV